MRGQDIEPGVMLSLEAAPRLMNHGTVEMCITAEKDGKNYPAYHWVTPEIWTQRFAYLNDAPQPAHRKLREYYPIRLVKSFSLTKLPNKNRFLMLTEGKK